MSCFGGRDEQIYIVEMLIDKLKLTPGKIKDIGEHPLAIKIKFLDFPVFEITREDFYSLKPPPMDEDGTLHFMIGRSCLFVMQPKELVRELQTTTVKVGVFRVGDTYPTAETELSLPGCLCDQIAMAQNDKDNLPKPFLVKSEYRLIDPGGNPSGTLIMEMRLTCFGRSIMTHYELQSKFFVFKNDNKEREFCVRRLLPSSYHTDGPRKDITEYGDRATLDEFKEKTEQAESVQVKEKKKDKKGGKKKGKK